MEYDAHKATPNGLRPGFDLPRWLWLAPGIVLFVAVLPMPYGFFMGMRWLVSGAAVFIAWKEYDLNRRSANSYVFIFGAIALIYNPIVPVHLWKLVWILLNVVSGAAFIGHLRLRTAQS